jgi:ribonuclease HII
MARVGVDEAGKGPVLGPMVAAAVRVREGASLPDGVADSKRLSAGRRAELAAALRERAGVDVGVATVGVDRIDAPDTDMNGLTVDGQADAVDAVVAPGDAVLADAGDVSEARFARRVADCVGVDAVPHGEAPSGADGAAVVTAEHGADDAHPVVGAASVVAKVERDARMAALADEHAELVDGHGPLGSGYPSDPDTRAFLASYVDAAGTVPPFARRSWATCEDLLAAAEQSNLAEF